MHCRDKCCRLPGYFHRRFHSSLQQVLPADKGSVGRVPSSPFPRRKFRGCTRPSCPEHARREPGGGGTSPSWFIFIVALIFSRSSHFRVSADLWQGINFRGEGLRVNPPRTRGGGRDVGESSRFAKDAFRRKKKELILVLGAEICGGKRHCNFREESLPPSESCPGNLLYRKMTSYRFTIPRD